jgi:hypothetical protein
MDIDDKSPIIQHSYSEVLKCGENRDLLSGLALKPLDSDLPAVAFGNSKNLESRSEKEMIHMQILALFPKGFSGSVHAVEMNFFKVLSTFFKNQK